MPCAAFPIAKFICICVVVVLSAGVEGCEASDEAHSISVRLNLHIVRRSRDETVGGGGVGGTRGGGGGRRGRQVGMSRAFSCPGESDNVVNTWNAGDIHSTNTFS